MPLLNPGALWLLPLVGLVVLLARMRPEPLRRAIANLHLWAGATRDERSLASSARPPVNLLFLLQVAFALLVIAALARPQLPWARRDVAIVVDLSASMGANDGNGTRLDLARQRAAAIAAALPASSEIHLVGAAASPVDAGRVRTGDIGRAMARFTATAGTADIDEAIQLARAAQTVVISDQPAPLSTADVRWIQVGHPVDNIAVTTLAARRRTAEADGRELLAEIANYGADRRDAEVVFTRDGREIARRRVSMAAGRAATATVEISGGGTFSAELAGTSDALPTDDRRSLVLRAEHTRVRLMTGTSPFVERALTANPDVTLDAGSSAPDLVVCACRELPEGTANVLMLPGPDDAVAAGAATAPLTADVATHRLLGGVDFAGLAGRATSAAGAVVPGPSSVVLRAGAQPVLVASERNGRRIVALDLNLDIVPGSNTNVALTPAFPILIANIVDWLAAQEPAATGASESDLRAFPAAPADSPVDLSNTTTAGVEDLFAVLLLGALAAFACEWWLTWRTVRGRNGLSWRIAITVLLTAAAARLAIPVGQGSTAAVAVLDRSDSVGSAGFRASLSRVDRIAAGMHDDDRLGVVVFGGDAAIERRPAEQAPVTDVRSAVTGSSTNIEAGLRLARTALPDAAARRLVLFTDGRETSGSALREAARAAAAGVRIDVVAPDPATRGPASLAISSITAPPDARENDPFGVAVNLNGAAGARGRVTVSRDGVAIDTRDVRAGSDGSAVLLISDSRPQPGHVTYAAALDGDETDRQGAVVNVSGQSRVLYAGGTGAVALAIEASGLRLTRILPLALPSSALSLAAYDLLVLDAVAVDQLTPAQTDAVSSYVDTGGGLLVLGSAATLNAASIAGSRLAPILPIDLRPRGGTRAPSTAFVFVFDKSGSMADRDHGVQKIELARQAVLRALDVRQSSDPFGVIAFDRTPTAVAPLAASPDAAAVAGSLRAIEPGGATAIAPAIEMAFGWLKSASTPKRHVLLVSDGRTSAADAERLRAIVSAQGIELSVIAIGPDADRDLLDRLARATGGRSYVASDIRDLPALAARDATAAAGGAHVEERFVVRAAAHPAMNGVDRGALPQLGGYVVSTLKTGAEPLLVSHLDDPILAGGRAGLGRVTVFTSDLRSPWASAMAGWSGFRQLWAQTARWTARGAASRTLTLMVSDRIGGPHLTVEAERAGGGFANALDLEATVLDPSGTTASVRLHATAPGRYEGDLSASSSGTYLVKVAGRDAATGAEERAAHAFYWSANRERSARGTDAALLTQIARVTGGDVIDGNANPFNAPRPWRRRDISSWLGAAALVLFIADLARRRRALAAVARWWRTRGDRPSPAPAPA